MSKPRVRRTRTRHVNPNTAPQPFTAWPGGKRRHMKTLLSLIPDFPGDYHEVFAGGAAMMFALAQQGKLDAKKIHLADSHAELMVTYQVLRDHPDDLIARLEALKALPHTEEVFYPIRNQDPSSIPAVHRAARFIYLMKLCARATCRSNRSGEFNAPFSWEKTNPGIFKPGVLHVDSAVLQGADIACKDFRQSLQAVQAGDFVFLDPPYDGRVFRGYCAAGFTRKDQEDLADEFERLAALGALVMMTNAATDWVRQRYSAYRHVGIVAKSSIKPGTTPAPELIIVGWQPATPAELPATPVVLPPVHAAPPTSVVLPGVVAVK